MAIVNRLRRILEINKDSSIQTAWDIHIEIIKPGLFIYSNKISAQLEIGHILSFNSSNITDLKSNNKVCQLWQLGSKHNDQIIYYNPIITIKENSSSKIIFMNAQFRNDILPFKLIYEKYAIDISDKINRHNKLNKLGIK